MARKQCAYCGEFVGENVKRCPNCREEIPERVEIHKAPQGGTEIRRGLLYMLLSATVYYFLLPGSPLPVPIPVPAVVSTYLVPLLFLLGLGFAIFGGLRRTGIL
jgi:hypothetical protein